MAFIQRLEKVVSQPSKYIEEEYAKNIQTGASSKTKKSCCVCIQGGLYDLKWIDQIGNTYTERYCWRSWMIR